MFYFIDYLLSLCFYREKDIEKKQNLTELFYVSENRIIHFEEFNFEEI